VFVLLDPMMPSRLAGAFSDGVEIQRVGLAEAVAETKGFLAEGAATTAEAAAGSGSGFGPDPDGS
jgi:ATP-dependent DNA helicase DinG